MAHVSRKRTATETIVSKTFNIRAESNGHYVDVEYKPGLVPFYRGLFSIDANMLPQLIEALQGMHRALTGSEDQPSEAP